MQTKTTFSRRFLSLFLSIAILVGILPLSFAASAATPSGSAVADAATIDGWKQYFSADTTRYAGGVYVDKTVFTAADAKQYFANDIADRLFFGKDNFGNDNFLVALSGIASNTEIVGYSAVPTDTILVLDVSSSMSDNSVEQMLKGTNQALEMLLNLNKNNRVGVVLYSGNTSTSSNATTSTATTILPLGRYTTTSTKTEWEWTDEGYKTTTYNIWLQESGNTISVASGVKDEATNKKVSGSKNVSGGTYMQNGIYFAYEAFEAAEDKVIPEGNIQAGMKRTPIMVLMGDGAPTIATKSYNDVGTSNVGDGGSSSSRISFLTQLTAAWTKAKVSELYGTTMQLYTLGIGTSNSQYATDVLNPMNTNSTTTTMWSNFITRAADRDGNVTVSGSYNNAFKIPKDTTGMLTSVNQRNYVDSYTATSTSTGIAAAFKSIADAIVQKSQTLQNRYYATLVNTDAENDGYISFSDEIGYGMEIKNIKGMHIGAGTLVTGDMFAEYMMAGKIITAQGELTDIGTELMRALQSRFQINATQARQLLDSAIANGDIAYTDKDHFSNYVSWYADADNNYIAPYVKGSKAAAPSNAKYLMKSYIYLGDVTQNNVETSMMYVLVRVKEELATGYQTMEANLPAALLPMVTYTIAIKGEELTEESIISMTNNANDVAPATLLYEVGLKDSIDPYNVAELSSRLIPNADGTYTFYTNRWNDENGDAFQVPQNAPEGLFRHGRMNTTVAHFVPATENIRYYYTSDTPVYVRSGSVYQLYTGTTAPTGEGYYHQFQYIVKNGDKLSVQTVYNGVSANALGYAKKVGDTWCVAAGTPKNFFSIDGHEADGSDAFVPKQNNATDTLEWSLYPQVAYDPIQGEEGYHVVGYLGNNGKITITPAQGIKLTKTVPETVAGADNNFTFQIALSGTTLARSYETRLVKTNGTVVSGTATVNGNTIRVTIGAGETLYITGLPAGTVYTVTEEYNAYYVASSANASGTVEEMTIHAVDFVNTPRGYGSLLISKDVVHPFENIPTALANKEFDITVAFSGEESALERITAPQGATKVANGQYTLKLKDGGDALFTNIPEGVTYTVTENLDAVQHKGFTLTTEAASRTGAIVQNVQSRAALVNAYAPEAVSPNIRLTGTKFVEGTGYTGNATYQIMLQQIVIGDSENVNVGDPVEVGNISKGGTYSFDMSSIRYTEPGTYSYIVYEVEPADGTAGKPANIAYDKTFAFFTIRVTDDDADGKLEIKNENITIHRSSATLDTTTGSAVIQKDFRNVYQAATVSFDMQKTVNGSANSTVSGNILFGMFESPNSVNPKAYALTDANGRATISLNVQQEEYRSGKYYYVREVAPVLADRVTGMTYDEAIKYVVYIIWEDGAAAPTVKYYHYSAAAENGVGSEIASTANKPNAALVINNTYDSNVTSTPDINLSGVKDLNGRAWKDTDSFQFALYITGADFKTDGLTPAQIKTVSKNNQNITFDGVTFQTVGTKYIVIKEVQGSAGGVSYDTTVYHITVNVVKAVDADGKTILSVDPVHGGSVSIRKSGASAAVDSDAIDFTNSYTIRDSETVKIQGVKTLSGRNLIAGEFRFDLYEAGNATPIATVYNKANGSFAFPALTYTTVGTYTYYVKEYAPADKQGVAYDEKVYTIVVTLTDDGQGGLNKTVTATLNGNAIPAESITETPEGATVALTFANRYTANGTSLTLSGKKYLSNRELKAGEFTFQLYQADASFNVTDTTPVKTATNNAQGAYSITLEYADGQEGRYYYVLSESIKLTDKMGISYDTTEYYITILVSDDGKGQLHSSVSSIVSSGHQGSIANGSINFSNVYSAEPVTEALTGYKGYNRPLASGMFEFVLTSPSNDEPLQTVKNNADGTFQFEELTFNAPGEYEFYVSETNGGSTINGVFYDSTTYKVTFIVEDDLEGKLKITDIKIVNNKGEVKSSITFANIYQAEATDAVVISGYKELTANGRDIREGEFAFELYEANANYEKQGSAIGTAWNKTDTSFTFDNVIRFTEEDTYYYVVAEKNLGADRMTYDTNEFGVKITVSDNGRGKLIASVEKFCLTDTITQVQEITFRNVYTPKDATLTIGGTKLLVGKDLAADQFEFALYAADDAFRMDSTTPVATAKNLENGTFTFSALTFNRVGTYRYIISEINDGQARVTYDARTFGVTVVVAIDENGDYVVIETAYTDLTDDKPVNGVQFKNIFTPKPEDLTLNVSVIKDVKNLGKETIGPENFTFILKNADTNEQLTKKTDTAGSALFTLDFTEEDVGKTFRYTLSEVNDNRKDVTYSTKVYEIEITIQLSNDNALVAQLKRDGSSVEKLTAEFENIYNPTEITPPGDPDKTGDSLQLTLWVTLMVVSAGAVVTLCKYQQKKEEK